MSTANFTIHPAADLFPMMTPEELRELAVDIQSSGLRNPIMLSHDGKQLIDGRNRLAACELGKVEPTFEKLAADDDPLAYIASINLMRRNLTKGQQAMALAMMYPEPEKGGRGKKGVALNSPVSSGFSRQRLGEARSVLHHSRSLAESVLKGITPLDHALATVKQQEQYASSDEAKLTRLRESAPDLADQVNEERLKIDEAISALITRQQKMREVSERGRRAAEDIVSQFVISVFAIQGARDQGDTLVIGAEQIEQLSDAMKLLMKGQPKGGTL